MNNPILDIPATNAQGRPVLIDSLVAELRTAPAPSVQRAAADLEAAQRNARREYGR